MEINNFRYQAKVRDYELDSQGIVNNATYVNYFEQCRNDFARALGIDFYAYHQAGFDLVVANLEIKYWSPLRIQDEFYVTAKISEITHKRIFFAQEIRHLHNDRLVAVATVGVACIDLKTNKSCMPNMLIEKLPRVP